MKQIGKFNLIEKNVCREICHCGWNIKIGGNNVGDLLKIEQFLKKINQCGNCIFNKEQ